MLSRLIKPSMRAMITPARSFRPGMVNPYKQDPTPLSAVERDQQTSLPVWDRVFDHKKYMQHQGPLKVSRETVLTCSSSPLELPS